MKSIVKKIQDKRFRELLFTFTYLAGPIATFLPFMVRYYVDNHIPFLTNVSRTQFYNSTHIVLIANIFGITISSLIMSYAGARLKFNGVKNIHLHICIYRTYRTSCCNCMMKALPLDFSNNNTEVYKPFLYATFRALLKVEES